MVSLSVLYSSFSHSSSPLTLQGCCFSRSEGPNSPYPGGAPSGSARAINVPPPSAAAAALTAAASSGAASARNASQANDAGNISSSSSLSTPSTLGSQRLRATASATAAAVATSSSSSQQPPPRPLTQEPLASHINKPIRRRRWTSRNRVWTRHSIDRERTDFFDTRVTGRTEIWQTLRAALEILWEADLVDAARGDAAGGSSNETATPASLTFPATPTSPTTTGASTEIDEARATAQTILDAADITLPTGDMAQGAYDAFGNYYALPTWIVSDPTNLDNDPEHNLSDLDDTKGALDDDDEMDSDGDLSEASDDDNDDNYEEGEVEDAEDDGDDTCNDEARQHLTHPAGAGETVTTGTAPRTTPRIRRHRRREEKGKAVAAAASASLAPAAHQIRVRARLSATSRDVVLLVGRDDTVRSLERRILEEAKLPHKTRVRIAYLGKILKDNAPLLAQGWKEGHVVNALIFGPAT
ncbi:hypothetical protein SCUCBS95973_003109 [Sporothrix curviconia]|uniref:Ubiquitin-like domain-containing protein n=1 Tax=Sporothrix curviconia TaxID=1260050 RepID=A0ABP0BCI7_9PEZI